jgi:hypothetical protein
MVVIGEDYFANVSIETIHISNTIKVIRNYAFVSKKYDEQPRTLSVVKFDGDLFVVVGMTPFASDYNIGRLFWDNPHSAFISFVRA